MEYLTTYLELLGHTLDVRQERQFELFQSELLSWNERINLTAAKSPLEIQMRHFADSLSCVLATGDLNQRVLIDVGSGAGFPGIPLKILFPSMKLTLLESVGKKTRFLREVIDKLELSDVSVFTERAETAAHREDHRQRYEWAVARAVAHLAPVMEYLLPFCQVGGCALAQKGLRATQELQEASQAIQLLGGGDAKMIPVVMPEQNDAYLVVVEKVEDTPMQYPRRVGIPQKRPL